MAGYIVKVDRVCSTKNHEFVVDLCMDKRTGIFFASVGGEKVEAGTKKEAWERTTALLDKVVDVQWRQVIILRVSKRRDAEDDWRCSENGRAVLSASCDFTYFRRERAANPLLKGRTIEREHQAEFEDRIARERKRSRIYSHDRAEQKRRADEEEQKLREERAALVRIDSPYPDKNHIEHEIPYTPEAWAGIERIAQTLNEMQAKLDAFTLQATPDGLAKLASGDVFKLLPAPKGEKNNAH